MMMGLTGFGVRLLCPGTDTAVAADTAAKGATDAAAAGADAAGAAGAADAGVAAAGAADAAGAGIGAADAAGAGIGAADAAGAASAALPEITVSAAAPEAAGIGAGAFAPAAAGALAAGSLAGGGGGAPASTSAAPNAGSSGDVTPSMLSATTPADISGIDPGTAQMLGIDTGAGGGTTDAGTLIDAGGGTGDAGTVLDPTLSEDPDMLDAMTTTPSGGVQLGGAGPTTGGSFAQWASQPRNALTLGMLGVSGMNALFPPKLPSAAKTALGAAGADVQTASMVINTGGTGSPAWPGMKANIDAQVDQYIQQQTESLMQTAANSGETGQNGVPTGVVKEQIASMTAQANTQRQAMYEQALSQLVNEAVSELTGSNQVLASIGNMQLAQQEQARAAAGQTAELALMLQQLSI